MNLTRNTWHALRLNYMRQAQAPSYRKHTRHQNCFTNPFTLVIGNLLEQLLNCSSSPIALKGHVPIATIWLCESVFSSLVYVENILPFTIPFNMCSSLGYKSSFEKRYNKETQPLTYTLNRTYKRSTKLRNITTRASNIIQHLQNPLAYKSHKDSQQHFLKEYVTSSSRFYWTILTPPKNWTNRYERIQVLNQRCFTRSILLNDELDVRISWNKLIPRIRLR